MISKKVAELINAQIAHEQYAAQYYLAMSTWFHQQDLEGIANYFRVQSKEELTHADKMFDYLISVDADAVELGVINKPPHDFKDGIDIFERALEHEKFVTQSIFKIVKTANDESDFATIQFLQWFINEQVEEESNASLNLSKMKMVSDNPSALYLFDQELAKRVLEDNTAE